VVWGGVFPKGSLTISAFINQIRGAWGRLDGGGMNAKQKWERCYVSTAMIGAGGRAKPAKSSRPPLGAQL
jgi:hypothetical protein